VKRLLLTFFTICIFMTSCHTGANEKNAVHTNLEPVSIQSRHLGAGVSRWTRNTLGCTVNTLWTFSKDTLYEYDMAQGVMTRSIPIADDVSFDNGCLEVSNETGHIFMLKYAETDSLGGAFYIVELDSDGVEVRQYRTDFPLGAASDMLVHGQKAFYVPLAQGQVFEYDFTNGQTQRLDLPNTYAIGACDNGLLLNIETPDGFAIALYAFDTETITQEISIDYGVATPTSAMLTDAVDSISYVYNNRSVYRVDLAAGSVTYLYAIPLGADGNICAFELADNRLYAMHYNGRIRVFDNPNGNWQSDKTLRVLEQDRGFSMWFKGDLAFSLLSDSYPNVQLSYNDYGELDMYYNTLVKKLLAKDKDFDVFIVNHDAQSIFTKHMFEDLSTHPALAATFDQMLPGVKALSSIDGKIIGVPIDIAFNVYTYDEEKLSAYGIQRPQAFQTVDEYFALFSNTNDSFRLQKPGIGISAAALFGTYCAGFFQGEQDMTENDVYQFLNIAKDMMAQNCLDVGYSEDGLFQRPWLMRYDQSLSYTTMPVAKVTGPVSTSFRFLCVNPFSDNLETALEFVRLYALAETETAFFNAVWNDELDSVHMMYTNQGFGEITEEDRKRTAESVNFPYLYENEVLAGNTNYAMYKALLLHASRDVETNLIAGYFDKVFQNYCQGGITQEAAAASIYKRMRLVKDE